MSIFDQLANDIRDKRNKNYKYNFNYGNNDLVSEGSKLKKDIIYDPSNTDIDNPIHASSVAFDVMNKYRGVLKYTISTLSGPIGTEGSNDRKTIYATISSPSLFNPYYGVQTAGIIENVPLIDTTKNNTPISAYFEGESSDSKDISGNISFDQINDCSIANLVNLSNEENSILGQARYKFSDFMYCRDVGKISNNYMITLRKFSSPISDNIFYNTTIDDESNLSVAGDVGRMITWFGTEENKLEDILKYSFNVGWNELKAEFSDKDSEETDEQRGIMGQLVNLFNEDYNEATAQGRAPAALSGILSKSGSSAIFSSAPYQNNQVVNGVRYDKNEIYEPKDTIRSTHVYNGSLNFTHEFTLTFNYKLRAYDNINAKSAFLDLLGNILSVTYRQGTFWQGEQRIIGAPQNLSGWKKAEEFLNNGVSSTKTFIGRLLNGEKISDASEQLANNFIAGLGSSFGIDVEQIISDPGGTLKTITSKAAELGIGDAAVGLLFNKLGRPAIYAFDSLLTNGPVGLWHVTIGNPLNPIATIGNLIMTNCEISHSGPLGLDDFPTDIKVVVTLKHGMPRDSVDIQRMYTKGRNAIYAKIGNSKNFKKLSGNSNKPLNYNKDLDYTNSWIGDNNIERISANKDTLK